MLGKFAKQLRKLWRLPSKECCLGAPIRIKAVPRWWVGWHIEPVAVVEGVSASLGSMAASRHPLKKWGRRNAP